MTKKDYQKEEKKRNRETESNNMDVNDMKISLKIKSKG